MVLAVGRLVSLDGITVVCDVWRFSCTVNESCSAIYPKYYDTTWHFCDVNILCCIHHVRSRFFFFFSPCSSIKGVAYVTVLIPPPLGQPHSVIGGRNGIEWHVISGMSCSFRLHRILFLVFWSKCDICACEKNAISQITHTHTHIKLTHSIMSVINPCCHQRH